MTEHVISVFVSYARESDEHLAWVTRLADSLEQRPEFHIVFDQYELHGGKDLTHFMERGVKSDRVVVVVTPDYIAKAEGRHGGVGYESSIISADLLANQLTDKFVPALRRGDERPAFLNSKIFIDFRDDTRFEAACAELVAALHRLPAAQRPAKMEAAPIAARGLVRTERSGPETFVGARPVVVIRCDVDGERNPGTVPTVENIGDAPATNVKIENINVNGARGVGTFSEIDVLRAGEARKVTFDAPDEGLAFRDGFVHYLSYDLAHRPPINWDEPRDLFTPLRMTIGVVYRDPKTGRRYRSVHDLEMTFGKQIKVTFQKQEEVS